ncbi:hypothetical protein JRI60_23950 [Archangium violaceum]|uniref:hypothetical protein n=1 Tax=Archangium violaceum TaxID=83451 RepID=UPI001951621D|nr:hypothetical protein [Archangium violaceum]QRO01851.1 hypothetical protein JRI60_23950 [Archangium violaceum]
MAALEGFRQLEVAVGVELNVDYAARARDALARVPTGARASVMEGDFFSFPWRELLRDLPGSILVIGNPPWVTNAGISLVGGSNLPAKVNFQGRSGIQAITGKSNFDISEWMLMKLFELLSERRGSLAMLCKTSVARKVLLHAWSTKLGVSKASVFRLDAQRFFGVSVDACLLHCRFDGAASPVCAEFDSLDAEAPSSSFGVRGETLVSDTSKYDRWVELERRSRGPLWRSGLKHDCARVMELRESDGTLVNGLGEAVRIERDYLYPLFKSSHVASAKTEAPRTWVIVPQRRVGEETDSIARIAPRTWQYLCEHGELLDARSSSIYRNKPRFSVFGVGEYTFMPWKVAISGLYKKLNFRVVPPIGDKPVVFDDTVYFVGCESEGQAMLLKRLLDSEPAREFFESLIFWDSKRPITAEILNRLDLGLVERSLVP